MLGFHQLNPGLNYTEANLNYEGVVYQSGEGYEDGIYSDSSELTSPHSDVALGGTEVAYDAYNRYVNMIKRWKRVMRGITSPMKAKKRGRFAPPETRLPRPPTWGDGSPGAWFASK